MTDLRYRHPGYDRLTPLRHDAAAIPRALAQSTTRLWPVWRGRHPVIWDDAKGPTPVFLPGGDDLAGLAEGIRSGAVATALLGGTPDRIDLLVGMDRVPQADAAIDPAAPTAATIAEALDRTRQAERPDPTGLPAALTDLAVKWNDLRAFGTLLAAEPAAIVAYARALAWWHQTHRFCSACGSPADAAEGGHARQCTGTECGRRVYPRTDPAVIVAVTDGDRLLLGRQPSWPAGMHSVLAGFVEPGESLEMTVAREVMEESGIAVTDIRYRASQPWPFPQSLMLGFTARATTTDIRRADEELEHAGWYSRADLLAVDPAAKPGDGVFCLPRSDSIARRLVEDWLGRMPLTAS